MTNKLREKIKEEFDDVLFQGQVDVYHVDNIIALIVQEKKALLERAEEEIIKKRVGQSLDEHQLLTASKNGYNNAITDSMSAISLIKKEMGEEV